jgi:hypothetical protein
LNDDVTLWQCTYRNPVAYVAFDDLGCASEVRYGDDAPASADFESCLRAVYATRRWDCASSDTHLMMFHTIRPNGLPR